MDAEFFEQMKPRFLTQKELEQSGAEPPATEEVHEAHIPVTDDPYPIVPSELKALPQWVLWAYEKRDGKQTKIPKQATGGNAKTDTPATWADYPNACASHKDFERIAGIGFVFSKDDPYLGVDLDNCIIDGKVCLWAQEILDRFQGKAYMEVSPSGNGIKIWTRAELPVNAMHKVYISKATGEAVEAYDRGRFFTVTGRGKYAIGDGQDAADWLVEKYLKKPKPVQPSKPSGEPTQNRTADDVIGLVKKSQQVYKFESLMRGDTRGYGSASEADMALCSLLAFWTRETHTIDAIFRQSQLYREKWNEKHRSDGATYGEMTIETALSQPRETYTPPKPKPRSKRREGFYEKRAKRRRYR